MEGSLIHSFPITFPILLHLPPELEMGLGEVRSGIRHCKDEATTTWLMVYKAGIPAGVAAGVQMLQEAPCRLFKGFAAQCHQPRSNMGISAGQFPSKMAKISG